jgi:hypothetical protein
MAEDSNQKPTLAGDAVTKNETVQPFFNTLPKTRTTGPLLNVGENSKVVEPIASPEQTAKKKKYMLWGGIAAGIIILLGVGGFLYYKYGYHSASTNNILVKRDSTKTSTSTNTSQNQIVATTPAAWQKRFFNNETCGDNNVCGDYADPDKDGLNNLEESQTCSKDNSSICTEPNNEDSDGDGISDGDEVKIFHSDPLKARTAADPKYNDADYIMGGYNPAKLGTKYTADELNTIIKYTSVSGVHAKTAKTLGVNGRALYKIKSQDGDSAAADNTQVVDSSTLFAGDNSPSAKLDRDSQRLDTVKKIGAMLISYQKDHGSYPITNDMKVLMSQLAPYNNVATNPVDPINKDPYVYKYDTVSDGKDFVLSYTSETQKQVIKYTAQNAQADTTKDQSSQRDSQRRQDLENLRTVLLIYSSANTPADKEFTFPAENKYKAAIMPKYLSSIPKDPLTNTDYEYKTTSTLDSFTLKATLELPPTGTTQYLCTQDECRNY